MATPTFSTSTTSTMPNTPAPSVPNTLSIPKIKPPTSKASKLPMKPTKINVATGKGTPGGFSGANTTKISSKISGISKPTFPKIPPVSRA